MEFQLLFRNKSFNQIIIAMEFIHVRARGSPKFFCATLYNNNHQEYI